MDIKQIWILIFLLVVRPAAVRAQFLFATNTDGTLTVSQYTGSDPVVIIPDNTNGRAVTGIGPSAFRWAGITNVAIPDSVTNIGSFAFASCSNLTSATLGTNVAVIGGRAFLDCFNLKKIFIPNGVTTIGNSAFFQCSNLISATIGNNTTNIGPDTFSYCTSLANIAVPASVATLGANVFAGCASLTNASIGYGAVTIPAGGFLDCTALVAIDIGTNVSAIGDSAFENCSALPNITLPDSVTNLGISVFYDCTSLTNAAIGNGVTAVSTNAFCACTSLLEVDLGTNVSVICDDAFLGCENLASVTIPNDVAVIGTEAFAGCASLASVTIPNSVTNIGPDAFAACGILATVVIGKNVANLENNAFSECPCLTAVYFLGNAPGAGQYLFADDYNVILYYLPGTTGWSAYFAGVPTVLSVPGPPNITTQPVSLTNTVGQTASFSATALGYPTPVYQWQKGGTNLSDDSNISGATSNTVTISIHSQSDAGVYSVVVYNSAGSTTSSNALLTITPELVENGGFEMFSTQSLHILIDWTVSGDTNSAYVLSSETSDLEPHGGLDLAQFGTSGSMVSISQTLSAVPGTRYLLSFWLNTLDNSEYYSESNAFFVTWDGNPLLNQTNLPAFDWSNFQFVVTAERESPILEFGLLDNVALAGSEDYSGGFGLDDVSVLPLSLVQPGIRSFHLAGPNLVMSGTNGLAGVAYAVLTSTNLSLPLGQWSPVVTNVLASPGNFTLTVTNAILPAVRNQFFIL